MIMQQISSRLAETGCFAISFTCRESKARRNNLDSRTLFLSQRVCFRKTRGAEAMLKELNDENQREKKIYYSIKFSKARKKISGAEVG